MVSETTPLNGKKKKKKKKKRWISTRFEAAKTPVKYLACLYSYKCTPQSTWSSSNKLLPFPLLPSFVQKWLDLGSPLLMRREARELQQLNNRSKSSSKRRDISGSSKHTANLTTIRIWDALCFLLFLPYLHLKTATGTSSMCKWNAS